MKDLRHMDSFTVAVSLRVGGYRCAGIGRHTFSARPDGPRCALRAQGDRRAPPREEGPALQDEAVEPLPLEGSPYDLGLFPGGILSDPHDPWIGRGVEPVRIRRVAVTLDPSGETDGLLGVFECGYLDPEAALRGD